MLEHPVTRAGQGARAAGGTALFFAAAFAFTWLPQLPALLAWRGLIPGPVERFMLLAGLGAFGPLLGAVVAAGLEPGGAGVRALFRPLGTWRVGARWYAVALGLPGALLVAGLAATSLLGGHDAGPWLYPPANPQRLAAMVLFPLGEEVGWRGFALPRLQARRGPLAASLIIGVLWALWHLPMFALGGVTPAVFLVMIPFLVGGSVVFTWIYNHTRGSLLLAVLTHVGVHLNNSHQALPGNATPVVVHAVMYVLAAAALLLFDRPAWRGAYRGWGSGGGRWST
jgi:membrane protease YdiL (CAAX protease family)